MYYNSATKQEMTSWFEYTFSKKLLKNMCERGGIGRRVGLKIQFRFRSVGSIPTIRTTIQNLLLESWQSWSNVPVLKTGEGHTSGGSNPPLSATI